MKPKRSVLLIILIVSFYAGNSSAQSEWEINDNTIAAFVYDSIFIKSCIGLNPDLWDSDSLRISDKIREINGVKYVKEFRIKYKPGHHPDLITLEQIKTDFLNREITGPYIYMVNHIFITKDIELFKLDRDYILKAYIVSSENFEVFKNTGIQFSIIKIQTKTEENVKFHRDFTWGKI